MIDLLFHGPRNLRPLVWWGIFVVFFQWWVIPFLPANSSDRWIWSLAPAKHFSGWFCFFAPILLLLLPFRVVLNGITTFIPRTKAGALWFVLLFPTAALLVFWFLRVTRLELGDARLIMDHFLSLTTYASVREPLESILHTELARLLFFNWGIHPKTTFQIHSCLLGFLTFLLSGLALLHIAGKKPERTAWLAFLFLVGPIHLFFGYVEWYTQLASGLILFEVYALKQFLTGRGLGMAAGAFIFAACSHLVGLAFFPAAVFLVWVSSKESRRGRILLLFVLAFAFTLGATMVWLRSSIRLGESVEATRTLFTTLLPLMREGDPGNPPGSWTYPWLSINHIMDLVNEVIICGLFPISLLVGRRLAVAGTRDDKADEPVSEAAHWSRSREEKSTLSWGLPVFFLLQLVPCGIFLLVWNPWLGFPLDWDLFSFFAWPLLAASLVSISRITLPDLRRHLLAAAGYPAFSIVFAWVLFHHHGSLPGLSDLKARVAGSLVDKRLQEADQATKDARWRSAYQSVKEVLELDPARKAETFAVFSFSTLQRMSEEWPEPDRLTPLAVDFEIIAASPMQRFLVLDRWGRIFFQEGGYFNDWSPSGLPEAPAQAAVDMEIVPWRRSAVVLADNGDLYEVPTSSWLDPNPERPRQTHFQSVPADRVPSKIGNFYMDLAQKPLPKGQKAVDLTVDHWNRSMIVLDTAGRLVTDSTEAEYPVQELAALVRIDAEVNYSGDFVFVADAFGKVISCPPPESIQVIHQVGWPAITDMELTRGGNDLYLLDGQGGVFAFSRLEKPFVAPERMRHFLPTGEPASTTPYSTIPEIFFIDLEFIPGEKAYYRMTRNFRIHYSEEQEDAFQRGRL